jgi:histidinol-phosphate aminotransferase
MLADDLNSHNDAYPLARSSQSAALATLQHENKIGERVVQLRQWTETLAEELRNLGVRTFPTKTYFFLADFAPADAASLAEQLKDYQILVKPLNDPRLGPGFMRVTTALPEDNQRFLDVLRQLLT